MSATSKTYVVQIAVAPKGVVLVYSDIALDMVGRVRLRHSDGLMVAQSADGLREFSCGQVSTPMAQALRSFKNVFWARFTENSQQIAVAPLEFIHI